MYAVIFKAEVRQLDDEYHAMAKKMRELAENHYGCINFISCTEGNHEIAVSYWESKEHIKAWKNDPEHLHAQQLGKSRWYRSYHVQVVEVLHEYGT